MKEYDEHPFSKKILGEYAVCIPQTEIDSFGRFFGYSRDIHNISLLLRNTSLSYVERADAEFNDQYKQLVSYIMLFNQRGDVLSFERGRYSTAKKRRLEGALCIGFDGHVNKSDYISSSGNSRLLSSQEEGIKQASIRKIREELRLQKSWLNEKSLELVGVINDDSSPTGLRHLGIVFKGVLQEGFDINNIKSDLSIRKIKFIPSAEVWRQFHRLEFWSQLVCKAHFQKPRDHISVIISGHRRKIEGPISIVGEIATGKTVIANLLSERYNLPIISTRECVAELTGSKDFKYEKRDLFSQKALELVSTEKGIQGLVEKIVSKIKSTNKNIVIIDGIRNLNTNALLAKEFHNLTIIFVDCPRDNAYNYYKLGVHREATLDEFRVIRHHEVEKEVAIFKNLAHISIYNAGSVEELYSYIGPWFDGRIRLSRK